MRVLAFPFRGSPQDRAPLIVANHMAFLDVLLAMSQACPSFVAKGDMKRVPVVGPIAAHLDCVFVPRRGALKAPHDSKEQEKLHPSTRAEGRG